MFLKGTVCDEGGIASSSCRKKQNSLLPTRICNSLISNRSSVETTEGLEFFKRRTTKSVIANVLLNPLAMERHAEWSGEGVVVSQ